MLYIYIYIYAISCIYIYIYIYICGLRKAIAALGISGERLVVVYGTGDYHAMIACRVLWGLLVAGVPDVRLLNGGLQAGERGEDPK